MKMSEANFKRFTDFYNFTIEKATDADIDFIMNAIGRAVETKKKELNGKEVNYDNPLMCKENYNTIKAFFEDFLANAGDDDAIYLIETLMVTSKFASEHPDKVAKLVAERKKTHNGKN